MSTDFGRRASAGALAGGGSAPPGGVLPAAQAVLLLTVAALFAVTFVAQPFRIPSESMQPTLEVGDFLLVNKQSFAPGGALDRALLPRAPVRRGDIAVFHYPVDASLYLVKRIVALPGDHLRLHHGQLLLRGRAVDEPYAVYTAGSADAFRDEFPAPHTLDAAVDPAWWQRMREDVQDGELWVPDGQYFVMGDNRNNSEDSRYWGFVPEGSLVGKPLLVYFALPAPGPALPLRARLRAVWRSVRVLR